MNENFPLLHDPPGHDEPQSWLERIPVLGWVGAYARQLELEKALVSQAVDRGPVPESAWDQHTYSKEIRQKIEAIVRDHAFPKGSTFHPLDPVELMFVLRYGDLNEVQIMMDIERQLGFDINEGLHGRLIAEQTTFIEFIRIVENATYAHGPE